MSCSNKYENYLKDLGLIIKKMALEAKKDDLKKKTEYSNGYLMGFHRVVSLMQQQAKGFNITLEEINLKDLDADKDLV